MATDVVQEQRPVLYKCPDCPCVFVSAHDLHVHMTSPSACKARVDKLGWRRSSFDASEICPSERDPELARACWQNGKVVMGIYEVSLNGNGKWLKRRIIRI